MFASAHTTRCRPRLALIPATSNTSAMNALATKLSSTEILGTTAYRSLQETMNSISIRSRRVNCGLGPILTQRTQAPPMLFLQGIMPFQCHSRGRSVAAPPTALHKTSEAVVANYHPLPGRGFSQLRSADIAPGPALS